MLGLLSRRAACRRALSSEVAMLEAVDDAEVRRLLGVAREYERATEIDGVEVFVKVEGVVDRGDERSLDLLVCAFTTGVDFLFPVTGLVSRRAPAPWWPGHLTSGVPRRARRISRC